MDILFNIFRAALKVDIQGAYDSVNWASLILILERLGVSSKMINWVRMCTTTNIVVNGVLILTLGLSILQPQKTYQLET